MYRSHAVALRSHAVALRSQAVALRSQAVALRSQAVKIFSSSPSLPAWRLTAFRRELPTAFGQHNAQTMLRLYKFHTVAGGVLCYG